MDAKQFLIHLLREQFDDIDGVDALNELLPALERVVAQARRELGQELLNQMDDDELSALPAGVLSLLLATGASAYSR